MSAPLLSVRDLRTEFRQFRGKGRPLRAVDGVSFDVRPGQALAIVGESGSGKSVTVRSLLGLLPRTARITGGQARFHTSTGQEHDLLTVGPRTLRRIRGREIGMVFRNA
ncbi:MAG TPA: ATP-binding cassette domain-containing protein, partial [Actinopolymorphaceae bacterium]|nr:ATP-binding cassette domain-containing protein [Actinopolymorphaceae bacterium]